MNSESATIPIWQCSDAQRVSLNINRFREQLASNKSIVIDGYQDLHAWSINNIGEFWSEIWEFCGVVGDKGEVFFEPNNSMLNANFFPEARLNFAENLLNNKKVKESDDALVFWGEDRVKTRLSWQELKADVSRMAQALRASGLVAGDRVAAYMPNMPETIVAMLAVSSIGAIWSSCSPDFGVRGVLDRFGQIEPKILIAADGYFYGGKEINNREKIEEIIDQLPSLEQLVLVPYLGTVSDKDLGEPSIASRVKNTVYQDYLKVFERSVIVFEQLPFDHPLFILFSSGTTGAPKCIVHGAGGTLLQHLKEHQLHNDVKPADRLFYFTTCTWMMWNWLVVGLASEATVLLYDGNPFYPSPTVLFDYADAESMTHFGTSAKYIDALKKEKLNIAKSFDLKSLRVMNSTGSPLLAESFDYVYEFIKPEIYLASISGGTDIISCFVLGDPSSNLYRGEIACCGLGMAVEIWDDEGVAIREEKGELVCVKAFPSMPVYFWGDANKAKYEATYFERYGDVWAQGDYAEITENNGLIIYGRSDATLNPGGVRIGTAEIYRQVDTMDEVQESVVIGQNYSGDVRIVLFVVMAQGRQLNEELCVQIKTKIRSGASPRHVPAVILQVDDIPRTKSGKISELAVRDAVEGRKIKNTTALANPQALEDYKDRVELAS